jgi:hypothetical protein
VVVGGGTLLHWNRLEMLCLLFGTCEAVSKAMLGKNRWLVTDEPVAVGDCRRITDHFRGIYIIYPNLIKEN